MIDAPPAQLPLLGCLTPSPVVLLHSCPRTLPLLLPPRSHVAVRSATVSTHRASRAQVYRRAGMPRRLQPPPPHTSNTSSPCCCCCCPPPRRRCRSARRLALSTLSAGASSCSHTSCVLPAGRGLRGPGCVCVCGVGERGEVTLRAWAPAAAGPPPLRPRAPAMMIDRPRLLGCSRRRNCTTASRSYTTLQGGDRGEGDAAR